MKERSGIIGMGAAAVFTAAKFSKVLLSGGTMLLSLWAYSLFWGWRFALGFVLLIFIHEMGHYIAARQKHLDVGLPTFIPFVGAWIALKATPMNVETESYVAFAGPLAGTVASLGCYLSGRYYGSNLLLALSYAGFFINLFNLLPLSPLDGGRITAILSPRIWLIGAPLLLALFLYRPSPLLIVLALFSAPQVLKAFRYDPKAPENAIYYQAALTTRLIYAALYLGLAGYLAVMSYEVHDMLVVR
ncbi:MAG TPA: site-2 protease family protein [Rhizomicrobium sp.]|nr:site-2 protease family protein [Rhizomicrobium sp.]